MESISFSSVTCKLLCSVGPRLVEEKNDVAWLFTYFGTMRILYLTQKSTVTSMYIVLAYEKFYEINITQRWSREIQIVASTL